MVLRYLLESRTFLALLSFGLRCRRDAQVGGWGVLPSECQGQSRNATTTILLALSRRPDDRIGLRMA